MKVIGVGVNKTGTTTLGKALEILGLTKHLGWERSNIQQYAEGKIAGLLKLSEYYNNFEDLPWSLMYRELYDYYHFGAGAKCNEEVKFILTVRKSEEAWYQSVCKHYERVDKDVIKNNYWFYDTPKPYSTSDVSPYKYKRQWIDIRYKKHNREVRAFFKDRPNFLEVCWENGDGWEELCEFLNLPMPNEPFPFLNKAPNKYQLFKSIVKKIF